MENPEPLREHHELDRLAGHFAGPERMHPSPWNATAMKAEAVTDGRIALDGFAVVQDYEQRLEDGSRFAGHGVFRYDAPSDTYEMHWFDSTGSAPRIFHGGFADRMLVLTGRVKDGWQRLTYDFNLTGGYRFKLETSDDGNDWKLALEGDNFEGDAPRPEDSAVAGRKMTGRRAAASNSSASKATAKKRPAKKASPTKKKAAAKKPAARKTASTRKKTAATTTSRKTAKKAAGKKVAKKTAADTPRTKKTGSRTTVSATERKRRQGTASKKLAAKKKTARGNGRAGAAVSQQKAKGGARRAPQMPAVKKTSTRTGGHRTAAKGTRMR